MSNEELLEFKNKVKELLKIIFETNEQGGPGSRKKVRELIQDFRVNNGL